MSTNNLSYSSELITNYLQAEIMSPDKNFEALQTSTGCALLFSISTNGVFYVTAEAPANSPNGWTRTDLSTAAITANFPGATVTNMCAAQNQQNGTFGLAMVVTLSGTDHILLSLGNSNSNMSWIPAPQWTSYPFDNPSGTSINVVNMFLSETTSGQFIVVDIMGANNQISRYYLLPGNTNGPVWNPHSLPIALDASGYVSCLGRVGSTNPDGMYYGGNIDGSAQLSFSDLYNPWGNNAPTVSNFVLPNKYAPEAIASCRNTDNTTVLFVTSNGGLYYFGPTNQGNGATGVLLFNNALFTGVTNLYSTLTNGIVTVWGLNSAHDVFYTTCPLANIKAGGAGFSLPLPILTGVDMVSPYVNLVNGGNTIFAVADSDLYILTKSPELSTWSTQQIMLPPPAANTPALSFSSYTTHMQLVDANNAPVTNSPVAISASTRTAFYINNLYTILDTTAININTDNLGKITLIQSVGGIQGTQLTVTVPGNAAVQINPMNAPFTKLSQLNTSTALTGATITYQNGTTKKLVSSTNTTDISTVATSNTNLSTAYTSLAAVKATAPAATSTNLSSTVGSSGLVADFGDLCNWIASGVEADISIVENDAKTAWNFVATIAGDVYSFELTCIENVVAAAQWVINKIISGVEDLINFLKYLFDLADIERTKGVVSNLMSLYLQSAAASLTTAKAEFDTKMSNVEQEIAFLTGISWNGLGTAATSGAASGASSANNSNVAANYLSYHYQNNASAATYTVSYNINAPTSSAFSTLCGVLSNEQSIFSQVGSDLATLSSNFSSMSLSQVLTAIAGIFAEAVVTSVQNIGDAVFEFLIDVADTVVSMLTTPIYVPVVSDILKDFGVSLPSILDVVGWLAAIPATVIYKALTGNAPFANAAEATFLTTTTTFGQPAASTSQATAPKATIAAPAPTATKPNLPAATNLVAANATTGGVAPKGVSDESDVASWLNLSQQTQDDLFTIGTFSGAVFGMCYAFINALSSTTDGTENPFTTANDILDMMCRACDQMAEIGYDPCPITSGFWDVFEDIFVIWRDGMQITIAIYKMKGEEQGEDDKYSLTDVDVMIDAIFAVILLLPSLDHFYELCSAPSGQDKTIAILDECSNVTDRLGKLLYAIIMLSEEGADEWIPVLLIDNLATAGLKLAMGMNYGDNN